MDGLVHSMFFSNWKFGATSILWKRTSVSGKRAKMTRTVFSKMEYRPLIYWQRIVVPRQPDFLWSKIKLIWVGIPSNAAHHVILIYICNVTIYDIHSIHTKRPISVWWKFYNRAFLCRFFWNESLRERKPVLEKAWALQTKFYRTLS